MFSIIRFFLLGWKRSCNFKWEKYGGVFVCLKMYNFIWKVQNIFVTFSAFPKIITYSSINLTAGIPTPGCNSNNFYHWVATSDFSLLKMILEKNLAFVYKINRCMYSMHHIETRKTQCLLFVMDHMHSIVFTLIAASNRSVFA